MALNEAQMAQFMAAQQAEQREQVLYQFNAGCMEMKGKTVTADPRKGKVILSMEDDGLLRFQWRLRHKDENEQQHFLFPNGAEWLRVNECKDGAVFLLKFKDSDVRRFFWSQEPKGEKSAKKEAEILRRISALIKSPPAFGAPPPKDEEEKDEPMTDVVTNVEAAGAGGVVLMQGTGHGVTSPAHGVSAHPAPTGLATPNTSATAPAPASAASTTAATTTTSGGAASTSSGAAGGAAAALNSQQLMSTLTAIAQQLQARQDSATRTGVEDVLDADRVQPILDVDSALVDALVEYLPEGQRSPEALRAQLRSPQMHATMAQLTQILNSSRFGQLMASLSLPVNSQTGLGVDAFLAAIQAQANKQKEDKEKK